MSDPVPAPDLEDQAIQSPNDTHSVEYAWAQVDRSRTEAVRYQVILEFDLPTSEAFVPEHTVRRVQTGLETLVQSVARRVTSQTRRV